MFLSEWREFPSAPCLAKTKLMTARVSMLLKSCALLTCFWACFLPGRAKDVSAPPVLLGLPGGPFLSGFVAEILYAFCRHYCVYPCHYPLHPGTQYWQVRQGTGTTATRQMEIKFSQTGQLCSIQLCSEVTWHFFSFVDHFQAGGRTRCLRGSGLWRRFCKMSADVRLIATP